ncbi:MAG: SIMPL domain-containing protein [Candidatus Zambryskibacteria bacterium]|nr:SIMPL domain-containing protein [Candidatus Zambryskibacteria bacterium]
MFNQFLGEEGFKRISKWAAISLMLLSAFLLTKVISELKTIPTIGDEFYPQSTISVSGEGEAYAIPDIATFNFSVVEISDTVAGAQEKAEQKINKALSILEEEGIEDKDIKTIGYNVYPKYEWNRVACVTYPCPTSKQVLVGYEVNQTITVKIKETDKAGNLVTKIGNIGVSNISGMEFTVDNRDKYIAEAREEAIKKAKEKAKILANQLGVRLGKIMYYNENGVYPYEAYGRGGGVEEMAVSAVPMAADLPAGETKITSNITITYEIK